VVAHPASATISATNRERRLKIAFPKTEFANARLLADVPV
jgi:hypothetical protein